MNGKNKVISLQDFDTPCKTNQRCSTTLYRFHRRRNRPHYDVYHPRELYVPRKINLSESFNTTNPFYGTKYHDMVTALNLRRTLH